MLKIVAFFLGLLISSAVEAQPQKQPDAAIQGLVLAVQQIGSSVQLYVEDVQRRLAEKDAQIAELKRLCGEPCKPPIAEAK